MPRVIRYILAVICLLLGIAGLVLPFLQGILLITVSIILFGFVSHEDIDVIHKKLENWKKKFLKK